MMGARCQYSVEAATVPTTASTASYAAEGSRAWGGHVYGIRILAHVPSERDMKMARSSETNSTPSSRAMPIPTPGTNG